MFRRMMNSATVMCGVISMNGDTNVTELYRTLTETK